MMYFIFWKCVKVLMLIKYLCTSWVCLIRTPGFSEPSSGDVPVYVHIFVI